jgi:COP9 signalosome complex subunit 4
VEWAKKKEFKGLISITNHLIKKEGEDHYGRSYITPEMLSHLLRTIKLGLGEEGEKQGIVLETEDVIPVMDQIVTAIRAKDQDFSDAFLEAVELLANLYKSDEQWSKAASTLSSFKFANYRQVSASAERRVAWFVETAECWLEIQDDGRATQQIQNAHAIISEVKDMRLVFRFKTCMARCRDFQRKYLPAALLYLELSQNLYGLDIDEKDIMATVENAVTCAILAEAGPPRSRVLAMLYSDERSKQLANFQLLEKMFKERIVRAGEVEAFAQILKPHHKAEGKGGRTVLQNAIIEHNMLAASKIYNNIKFDQLGTLLSIGAKEAESLAATMIEGRRMKAVIDQVEGLVEFQGATAGLDVWDVQIRDVCSVVNGLIDAITTKSPKYVNLLK